MQNTTNQLIRSFVEAAENVVLVRIGQLRNLNGNLQVGNLNVNLNLQLRNLSLHVGNLSLHVGNLSLHVGNLSLHVGNLLVGKVC
jgi:uncharacterized protein YpmS